MKIKYLETRERANGKTIFVVSPPKYVQDAIEVGYEQFDNKKDAMNRAIEVADAFQEHKKGNKTDISIKQDTVKGLISFYRETAEWKKLSDNSKEFYTRMINTALTHRLGESKLVFGDYLARSVSASHTDQLYSSIKKSMSDHRATSVVKVLRKIWFVGIRHSKVSGQNPFAKMGLKGLSSRTTLWTPKQVHAFIDAADKEGHHALGTMALLCYDMCQRPGDMRKLIWSQFDGSRISLIQEKTKQPVKIPCSPRLIDRLKACSVEDEESPIIVCEATGNGYDRRLYSKHAAKVRSKADLPTDLKLSDLRRTGATEMAESGCTEDELRSVTGHQSRDVLSIYVRPTDKLAESGISRRFGS